MDSDWKEKVEALSQEGEAIRLREALNKAFADFLAFYSTRGVIVGICMSGENIPNRKMN